MTPDNLATLTAFNTAFNRHDIDAMMALMTDDCLFDNTSPAPDGTRIAGQDAVRAFWVSFFAAAPNARIDFEDIHVSGDRAVQRWVYHWSDDGHVRGVDVLHFREGKIAEKLSYVKG
jgi:ketosteroid isomerase-like protein